MRKILCGAVALVLLVALFAIVVYNTVSGQDALLRGAMGALMAPPPAQPEGLRVVICGSASPLGNDPARAQACIAVVTPEHFFLFDVGARSPQRIGQARLPMDRLDAVFITHYHSDHIAALPDVNLASWVQGRRESLEVYGPAGIDLVVDGFNLAYRLDRSYRTAHHGDELVPPAAGPMTPMEFTPGDVVWNDGRLKVTSFPVEHPPIEPAVGYRVDYRGRSVVISGDSNAADSLFAAAEGADLLLHDALSRALLDPMIAAATERDVPVLPTIMTDVIDYHADTISLPERAKSAGIRQLAYYHLVPVPPNGLTERVFRRGLPADVILVDDLQTFDLPPDSTDIVIRGP